MVTQSFPHNAKLAGLYIVRDHIMGQEPEYERSYSQMSAEKEPLSMYEESEFLQAVYGKDSVAVWCIIDELMEFLKIVNFKVYSSVIRKIYSL